MFATAEADMRNRRLLRRATLVQGAALYLASFFLPAVHGPEGLPGWFCAWMSFVGALNNGAPALLRMFLLGCALINPFALTFLVLRFCNAEDALRLHLAKIAQSLILAAWIAIAMLRLSISIGHLLWVAGLVRILAPELLHARH
jgi:hypothetical protein